MRYFRKIMANLDPAPVLAELAEHEPFWSLIQLRQQYDGTNHKDTETIVLRGPTTVDNLFDNLQSVDFPQLGELPQTMSYLGAIIGHLEARDVGRIMAVRLKAGGQIKPHTDEGAYARYFARFHAPLVTNEACLFNCGDDVVHMRAGSLWWFNHQVEHSVSNHGPARIHLIIDACAPGFTGALPL